MSSSEPPQERSPAAEKPNPFAALGSAGSQFGAGGAGGFSFGVPNAAAPKPEAEEEAAGDGEEEVAPEEECQVGLDGLNLHHGLLVHSGNECWNQHDDALMHVSVP